ncbi:MAG TPA: hypothetical protein VHN56_08160 [Actinomycetota bacterium]|jgi:hypothetical protein|nr:hypothetical protein [Actinomycetota bacterium]
MERATSSSAWKRAYELAFADARKLPILVRLTPLTLPYVTYKQLRYLPAVAAWRNG